MNMNRKGFKGKAIYNPQGKAGEYSQWACNFYNGCSNDCEYCYCKRGFMSHVWSNRPTLKKCFKDETDALKVFEKELMENIDALRKSSLFFTFTSDPFLDGVMSVYVTAITMALANGVRVQVLTKMADFVSRLYFMPLLSQWKDMIAFGFTLTGHDELEPNAAPNQERIRAMKMLHDSGFRTFASIEPIIDFESSKKMIQETLDFCDLYKIGLRSGVPDSYYSPSEAESFFTTVTGKAIIWDAKIYWKQSFSNYAKKHFHVRYNEYESILKKGDMVVGSDYDIFER